MRRHRRALAVITALLWLLGVEALPNLHLAGHSADHTHAQDGTIVTVSFATSSTHEHADGSVHADHDATATKTSSPLDTILDVPAHAASGIAHHATAIFQPPVPLTAPVSAPFAETFLHAAPLAHVASISMVAPSARGPPTA